MWASCALHTTGYVVHVQDVGCRYTKNVLVQHGEFSPSSWTPALLLIALSSDDVTSSCFRWYNNEKPWMYSGCCQYEWIEWYECLLECAYHDLRACPSMVVHQTMTPAVHVAGGKQAIETTTQRPWGVSRKAESVRALELPLGQRLSDQDNCRLDEMGWMTTIVRKRQLVVEWDKNWNS